MMSKVGLSRGAHVCFRPDFGISTSAVHWRHEAGGGEAGAAGAGFARARGVATRLVATGQHRDLFGEALAGFGLAADLDLGMAAATPDALVGQLVPALADVIRQLGPAWVVVQGDTSSTLAGALAARYAGARLAHVEAGLRTGTDDPHPEEMHRKLVAQMAELHFAPTPAAAAALAAEGVCNGVHVTGNSGIDALLLMAARLQDDAGLADAAVAPLARVPTTRPWLLATLHRRENRGRRLAAMLAALGELADEAEILLPVHPSPAVAVPVQAMLGGRAGVHLLPPLPFASFVALMLRSRLVLTDSGGVQEEAPALGLPAWCCARAQNGRRDWPAAMPGWWARSVLPSWRRPAPCWAMRRCMPA